MSGRSMSPGTPASTVRSSSRMRPASMFVWPSFSRMVEVISREANVGNPAVAPVPVPEMLLNSIFSVSDTSSS